MTPTVFAFPPSAFVPLGLAFFGLAHVLTGLLLMYLTYGIVLNLSLGWHVYI